MAIQPGKTVLNPNLGIYLDRPQIALGPKMLHDGLNFRVKEGRLSNLNLGWDRFESSITLNGPVVLIKSFFLRSGTEKIVFGTLTDIYSYDPTGHTVAFLSPIYATGTASASGTAVLGVGTTWSTNTKAGDQIHFGSATYTGTTGWFTIQSVTDNTHIVLTASAGTVTPAAAYTIRKTFTGDLQDIWITDYFANSGSTGDDELFMTNGVDPVVKWEGSDAQVTTPVLGFTCKTLTVFSNMMIYGNIVQGGTHKPTDIINSDIGTPDDVTNGISEQFKVHSGDDEILCLAPLGDALAIYSRFTVSLAQFVGDPIIFVFRNAITGIGALSSRAVADFGNYHEFLSIGSAYQFDGATIKEVGKQIFRDVLRTQDPSRRYFAYNHFDEEQGDLIWVIPLTTDTGAGVDTSAPAKAIVEHYLEEVGPNAPFPASIRTFPFTATGYYTRQSGNLTWAQLTGIWSSLSFRWNDQFFFAAFPLNLAGDIDGKLYTINTSSNANTAALPSFVRFGRFALSNGRVRGLLRRIYPFVAQQTTDLDVTVHMSDHAMGPDTIDQTDTMDQTLPEGGHFVSPFRRGRFAAIEFGTDGPSQPWELSGYDTDLTDGGDR